MSVDAHAAVDPTTDEPVVDALAEGAAGPIDIVDCADVIDDFARPLVVCTAGASTDVDVVVVFATIVVVFGPGVDIVR